MPTPLTPHFTLEELTKVGSHVGMVNDPPQSVAGNLLAVAEKLEQARAIWNCPVLVSYGYRSPALNDACGGSPTSAHMDGLAADAVPTDMTLREGFDALVADPTFMADVDQLIIERGCVHVGLPTEAHAWTPRHELRLEQDVAGVRTYPLYGYWTISGVSRV